VITNRRALVRKDLMFGLRPLTKKTQRSNPAPSGAESIEVILRYDDRQC
jgi:hypothetical protein